MIENTCGSLASCEWLLHIYHLLMVTFIKYMPHTFKCVYAISHVATFWQKKKKKVFTITYGVTHIFLYTLISACHLVKTVFFKVEESLDTIATCPCLLNC